MRSKTIWGRSGSCAVGPIWIICNEPRCSWLTATRRTGYGRAGTTDGMRWCEHRRRTADSLAAKDTKHIILDSTSAFDFSVWRNQHREYNQSSRAWSCGRPRGKRRKWDGLDILLRGTMYSRPCPMYICYTQDLEILYKQRQLDSGKRKEEKIMVHHPSTPSESTISSITTCAQIL